MGVIKSLSTGEYILLNSEHVFGRNPLVVHTTIDSSDVSRSHATIRWAGHKWVLQDHSLNGTLVNQSLVSRSGVDLAQGNLIRFGQLKQAEWELIDAEGPVSYLKCIPDPAEVLALAACPGIATPDNPAISFFLVEGKSWRAEVAGLEIDLKDGVKLKMEGKDWVFVENGGFATTVNLGTRTSTAHFLFQLSPDEERISIEIRGGGWQMDMGERAHNYLLLALARKRLEDAGQDPPLRSIDQGWMDLESVTHDLGKEFRKIVDEYQVNLQVHRIRKQLMGLKPYGYLFTNVVERRKGELRFAHPFLEIQKEGEVLGSLLPR